MTLKQAKEMLEFQYEKAKNFRFVKKPLAYALYQVWKEADRKMATKVTVEKMTNADRIRSMSDEELAWELMTWRIETAAIAQGIESNYPNTKATILEWLRQPAE